MKLPVETDKLIRRAMITSIVVTALLFILPAVFWVRLREEVPLLYSLPWGEDQVVNKTFLFTLGGISLSFVALNLFLSRILGDDIFLKRILWAGCATASILALITLVRIVLLF